MPTPLALVGIGKIARDQHLPAIAADPDFELAATVSRHASVEGVPSFPDIDRFLAEGPEGAVVLCVPPAVRTEMALKALAAGRHVLLEKPPAPTLGEVEAMTEAALVAGRTLFATWHSRFAPAVAPARDWLWERTIQRVEIAWREDVRRWHPGQDWIWEPGGFGVFDPGINALSILTTLLDDPIRVEEALLETPENRAQPIAARLSMRAGAALIQADFDWRQTGPQTWAIAVETDGGRLDLTEGGAAMAIDGAPVEVPAQGEYPALYRHFAELIATAESDVDAAPLRLVADAFLCGRQVRTAPFIE